MKAPPVWLVIALAVLVRLTWFFIGMQHPSSDDLQYALMAEAIRHGEAFPLVAWGIGYGGTITTSWVLAGLFTLFGPSLQVVLGYGAALSLIQVVIWMKIAKAVLPGSEGWAGLLLAVPSAHMGIMMQQLSYADALAVGAWVVWLVICWSNQKSLSTKQTFGLAALIGYLFYTHPIPTVFAAAVLLFWRQRVAYNAWAACLGFFVGAAPLLLANLTLRGITVRRIGARVLNMSATQFSANANPGNLIIRLAEQVFSGIQAQPRLIAESFSTELGMTFLGIGAAAGLMVLLFWSRGSSARLRWVAWPVIIATLLGNTLFGHNARARFLMPAYATGSLLAAAGSSLAGAPGAAVAVSVAALNGAGTWQRVQQFKPGIPYRAAIDYLVSRKLAFGYADFWQALPLNFLSQRSLIVASTATDASGFWDRTTHITRRVSESGDIFYVFDASNPAQQLFIQAFEALISQTGLQCERANIPPLRIYSRLSRPVRPEELDTIYRAMGFAASQAGR